MSPRTGSAAAIQASGRGGVALFINVHRNLVIQALGLSMVALTGLGAAPWTYVAGWAAVTACVLAAEDLLLRRMVREDAGISRLLPVLRICITSLYALAVLVMIARGGPVERLFAFAVMSMSMVHVLMRYYRSPWIMAASLAPYVAIMALIAVQQAKIAAHQGNGLREVTAFFALAMFGLQFWLARGNLAAAWTALMAARQAAEERERAAEAASRAKSNFLATMSHELRTPLNGVLGMVQALTGEQLTEVQRERVKIIRRSSESLLAVLNDLLDLSKIESSALELELADFDLEHLVRGVVAAYEPLADKKGLSFAFDIEEAACGSYLGDSARIRRILYSLADNAVKFTEGGGMTLGVRREGGEIVFQVSDTGIGIDPGDMERLFEGFYQADASLSRRYGGAGLGLAICRQMTTLMDGSIEATSTPGEGSTFTVRLPLACAAAVAAPSADDARPDAERPGGVRVLAAEDNDVNQLVLKTLLSQAGIEPTLVENGRQALDAWETQTWDIILMDIQMPVMDGVVATRAIREREAETGRTRTPILAVTANAMTHQVA
jgi:signal transduction histidine kinase/CheY-like chemotaxis protein